MREASADGVSGTRFGAIRNGAEREHVAANRLKEILASFAIISLPSSSHGPTVEAPVRDRGRHPAEPRPVHALSVATDRNHGIPSRVGREGEPPYPRPFARISFISAGAGPESGST